ncbi:MAG: RES family NAD+ phosphorylase [Blastocatellia bacterium]
MQVWRISKAKYAATAYSGEGARLEAGRWHQAGHRVVYASASAALAALEILVHTASDLLPRTSYVAIPADIPEDLPRQQLTVADLPPDWQATPAPPTLRALGMQWLQAGETALLAVPSVIVPFEWNYLLNPLHPDFSSIRLGSPQAYRFDPRLK